MTRRIIPAQESSAEITVVNSRFLVSISPAFSVAEARQFIERIRCQYQDASHNVPVFIIGHGASITEHCSDDGEPEGTAGRPALAVLKGSGLGDVALVITRYFGGTKLGTGGLVCAYGDAVRAGLAVLPLAEKIATITISLAAPYNLFERLVRLIDEHQGQILSQEFAGQVSLVARFTSNGFPAFEIALRELSRGALIPQVIEQNENSIFPMRS